MSAINMRRSMVMLRYDGRSLNTTWANNQFSTGGRNNVRRAKAPFQSISSFDGLVRRHLAVSLAAQLIDCLGRSAIINAGLLVCKWDGPAVLLSREWRLKPASRAHMSREADVADGSNSEILAASK